MCIFKWTTLQTRNYVANSGPNPHCIFTHIENGLRHLQANGKEQITKTYLQAWFHLFIVLKINQLFSLFAFCVRFDQTKGKKKKNKKQLKLAIHILNRKAKGVASILMYKCIYIKVRVMSSAKRTHLIYMRVTFFRCAELVSFVFYLLLSYLIDHGTTWRKKQQHSFQNDCFWRHTQMLFHDCVCIVNEDEIETERKSCILSPKSCDRSMNKE